MTSITKPKADLGELAKRVRLIAEAFKSLPRGDVRFREEAKNLSKELKAIAVQLRGD
jgi:hypothetical protein